MKGREKMDREEFMRELEDMFQDEPDNNKLNVVLDLADAYVEYAVVQEVVNEFWEREEGKDADCKPE